MILGTTPTVATLHAFGKVFDVAVQSLTITVAADSLSTVDISGFIQLSRTVTSDSQ